MTYGDIQLQTPEEKCIYYVYIWYIEEENKIIPFYVGMGSKERYKSKSCRSQAFKDFVKQHPECKCAKLADGLAWEFARFMEIKTKELFANSGIMLLDGEDNKDERKRRQREGIDVMPIINGKRTSTKTGRPMGRPTKKVEYELLNGETVSDACKRLGISRTQWYRARGRTA